ncbi:MAG: hypothetical protein MO852_16620, partial [Candidatus Devosia euplotis]|nr:hypothetical protein [Candidatus Devosia euplotis]
PWFVHTLFTNVSASDRVNMTAWDADGDGVSELAVGAPFLDNDEGGVALVYVTRQGSRGDEPPWGKKRIYISAVVTPDLVGLQSGLPHRFGAAVEAARLTDTTRDDLLVGAPQAAETVSFGSSSLVVKSGGAVVHLPGGTVFGKETYWGAHGPDSLNHPEFGSSIARVEGNCSTWADDFDPFVVGAPGEDADRGALRAYGCSVSGRTPIRASLEATLTGPQSGSRFGEALDAIRVREEFNVAHLTYYQTDRFVAVGAPRFTTSGLSVGKVYIYERTATGFSFVRSFVPSTRDGEDRFGRTLAFARSSDSEDDPHEEIKLAIGMPRAREAGNFRTGKVYLWRPWENPGSAHVLKPARRDGNNIRYGTALAPINDGMRSAGFVIGATNGRVASGATVETPGVVEVKLNDAFPTTG